MQPTSVYFHTYLHTNLLYFLVPVCLMLNLQPLLHGIVERQGTADILSQC